MKVREILGKLTEASYANEILRRFSKDDDPRVMSDDPRVRSQGYKADDEKHYQKYKDVPHKPMHNGKKISREEHFSKTGKKLIYFAPNSYVLYTPGESGEVPEETKHKLLALLKANKVHPEYIKRVQSLTH